MRRYRHLIVDAPRTLPQGSLVPAEQDVVTHRPVNPEPLEPPPMSPTHRRRTRSANTRRAFRPAALLALLLAFAICAVLTIPRGAVAAVPRNVSAATTKTASTSAKQKAKKLRQSRKTAAATLLRRKITGLQVTDATATSVSLRWRVSPSSAGVTGYTVTRDGVVVATPTLPRAVVTGMQCGRTAIVAVRARGYFGAVSLPTSITVSTDPCPDLIVPSTPTGLAVAGRTQSVLSLRWAAASDNVGVVDYEVFVGPSATADTAETSVSVGGLSCGTTYAVGVRSVDGAGNRSTLAQISAATSGCSDTQAPSTPTLTATLSGAKAQLSWTAASDNMGVTSYAVYRGTGLLVETASRQYTTGDLACGQSHTFGVEARDAAGNRSGRGTATVQTAACPAAPAPAPSPGDTSPPSAPSSPQVTGVTATSISLSWTASSDNRGVEAYGLYRNDTLDHSATGLTSSFTGLVCGTTYTLGIDAVDAAGNRSAKTAVSTSTAPCPDAQAPTTPGNLRTTSVTQTSAAIAWDPSSDDGGVLGYGVYWSGVRVADTADTSFVLTGLDCGTSTTVEVDAVDGSGNRSSKASRLVSTSTCLDTQAPSSPTGLRTTSSTQNTLTLAWNVATDNVGVTGYDVFRNGTKVATGSGTSQTVSGLACGTTYTLGVEAFDAVGNRSVRSTMGGATSGCSDAQAPTTPSGLQATSVTATSVTLSWSASNDNVGVTGYDVFNGSTRVATATGTSQALSGLTCATSYVLGVEAVDAAGNHSSRGTLAATTGACPTSSTASYFLSPSGNDANACTVASPCRSLQRGVSVAQPGQVVELAAGTYVSGSVTAQKAAPGVTLRIASSGTVTLPELSCSNCAGVTLEGDPADWRRLDVSTFYVKAGQRVTLRYAWQHWDGNGGNSGITDASDQIWIDHNELGPVTNCGNFHINTHIPAYSTNVRFTGNFFHDFQSNSGCHSEAIWMAAVDGGEMTGNKFKRIHGNTANVFFTTTDSTNCQGVRNFTVSRNYFGPPSSGSGYGVQWAYDPGGSGDCSGAAPHAVHQNIDFSGNCWDGNQVLFGTLTNPGMSSAYTGTVPGGSMVGEYGSLDSAQHTEAVAGGFTFSSWPFQPIGSCPLDSSG